MILMRAACLHLIFTVLVVAAAAAAAAAGAAAATVAEMPFIRRPQRIDVFGSGRASLQQQ